jgi:UDP-2,3-diacylglucosamine pyrophosphatase LpxH
MKINDDFIRDNTRIQIISNSGRPTPIPQEWRPVLGDTQMVVVVPDMHMYIAGNTLDNFKWGAEAMIDFLAHVNRVKRRMDLDGALLRMYQIGDMYELRFPGRDVNATVTDIKLSSDDYSQILDAFEKLFTNKVYGNHDFENRHFQNSAFCYTEGKIYLEHGFAADNWTANPQSPLWDPVMLGFYEIRQLNEFFNNLLEKFHLLNPDKTSSWGVTSGDVEQLSMPTDVDYENQQGYIKKYYVDRMHNGVNGPDCRITIIGHTHMPYLDSNIENGRYIYIDCGAWTVGRSNFVVVTDEELALCHYKRT